MQIRSDRGWIKAGLAVLVAGVLGGGVLAAACGTDRPHKVTADGVTGPPGDAASAPLASAPTPPEDDRKDDPEVGDKIPVGDDGGSVTVSAVEDDVSAGRLFGAGEGNKYVAAEVKGCSGPNEKNISFQPAYFLLRLDDGTVHDPGVPAKKPSLEGGTIPSGKCLSGWVTFTVKKGAYPTAVIYDGSSRLTWTVPLPKNAKQTTTTTMKAGAVSAADEDPTTTTTAGKAKTTSSTTSKTTSTTAARGSTATTSKASTSKASSTTTTATAPKTGKSAATTTSTSPAPKSSTSTTTTKPSSASTTSTTAAGSGSHTTTPTTADPGSDE